MVFEVVVIEVMIETVLGFANDLSTVVCTPQYIMKVLMHARAAA